MIRDARWAVLGGGGAILLALLAWMAARTSHPPGGLGWPDYLLLAGAGCKKGPGSYVPSSGKARQALEVALNAWKGGQKPGRLTTMTPPVEVIDARWKAGDRLASFEVLQEEESDGSKPRWFTVRLKLEHPASEQTVRYAVLGNDPLWVYREADFQKLSGM